MPQFTVGTSKDGIVLLSVTDTGQIPVTYQFTPDEAGQIADGLIKAAISVSTSQRIIQVRGPEAIEYVTRDMVRHPSPHR